MGYGDNEPPAIRADPYPATLAGPAGFRILVLTFVRWDVIKFTGSTARGVARYLEIPASSERTEFQFDGVQSGAEYTFTAQGCAKALDGSTTYCSPASRPHKATAAVATGSVMQFLHRSGLQTRAGVKIYLKPYLIQRGLSTATLLGIDG